ncbi:MAG: dipeptidase [Pseudomonadota bacterium]
MRKFLIGAAGVLTIAIIGFFAVVPGVVEKRFNAVYDHNPYSVSERAQRLHNTLFVADLHADTLLWRRNLATRASRGHVDIPRLQSGNLGLQVFSATTKSPSGLNYDRNAADSRDNITTLAVAQRWPVATWNSLYARAEYQLQRLIALTEAEPDRLLLIRSRRDLDELVRRRTDGDKIIGAMYLIEGAHPLEGDLDNLDRLFEQGLRIIGLVHFFDNDVAGSLHGLTRPGLTEFGRAVVRRAEALGMMIDIAHASPRAVSEVLDLATRPVLLSHGGLRGNCPSPRNLDDDLMRRMAEAGGLVGIGFWSGAVCDATPDGIVAAIRYAIDTLGVDHVALGSDFDGAVTVAFDAGELAVLTDRMLAAGFSDEEIAAVMGGNVERFLRDQLPAR